MSEITLSLEHPSLGCGEIIARYDLSEIQEKAYQQGRADKYKEITSEYMLLTEEQVADIRADAIDLIDRHLWNYSQEVWEDFKPILKQLKEQSEKP